jgi:hypothetical protein
MMSYNNLYNYYMTSRILKKDFNYDLFEQENMIPFERELTIAMIIEEQKKEKEIEEARTRKG